MQCLFSSKPRWERRKDARPQELLAAALDLFVERGFASTRLDDVAKRAGVSKGTLYLYFSNKEELFKAVVRENILPSIGEAENSIAGFEGSSVDLFRALVFAWWHRIGETPASGICKLVMSEAGNFPELAAFYQEEVIQRSHAMITRLLDRGIARGEFRNVDTIQLANVLAAPIVMLMLSKHSFNLCQVASPEEYLNKFIDLCLHGLLKTPAGDSAASSANAEPPC
ncbi:MAG: TetR/AcrR family transcriptional regulator [Pseudomonadota bacterium]